MYKELRRYRDLGERGRLDAANIDLLWLPRSAVVASMSALDAYVHGALYGRIPHVLRTNPVPQRLCEEMASVIEIRNEKGFRSALSILSASDSITILSEKFKNDSLAFLTYQAPDKIVAGYKLIGYEDIFEDVAALWPGPNTTAKYIKDNLSKYYRRRNQIAHEGDRDTNGADRAMQPQYAKACEEFVVSLVTRLNRVVYGL
jgi:hypothetical protein